MSDDTRGRNVLRPYRDNGGIWRINCLPNNDESLITELRHGASRPRTELPEVAEDCLKK